MGNQILTNKTLYHIVNSHEAEEIEGTGFILPCDVWSYMSVNLNGDFDHSFPLDYSGQSCPNRKVMEAVEKGQKGWISGRSYVPNIFLSDSLDTRMPLRGNKEELTHAYTFTVQEIMKQGLKVFKNPSAEFPTLYNIPFVDKRGIKVGRITHVPETVTELLKRGKI